MRFAFRGSIILGGKERGLNGRRRVSFENNIFFDRTKGPAGFCCTQLGPGGGDLLDSPPRS